MSFEETLEKEGKLIYKNVGVSMLPWIHEGKDLIVIEKITSELKKYDSVLFVRPHVTGRGRYVLHRIMKIYEDGSYYIIGDNTDSGERVCRDQILGILTYIIQPGKQISVEDKDYQIKVWLWWHFGYYLRKGYRLFKRIVKKILILLHLYRKRER